MCRTKSACEQAEQRIRVILVRVGLDPGEVQAWSREYFWNLGLHRLRGTVRDPEQSFWQKEAA